jgi:hypothetical protein
MDPEADSAPATLAPESPVPTGEIPDFTPVPRERMRRGGWSAERQRAFIEALADTGSVRAACKRLGVGEHHIYKLRRHPEAASFRAAWEAALDCGIQRVEDVAMDRALNGVEEPVYHCGEIIGTRRVFNDRLLMFLLKNRAPDRFAEGAAYRRGIVGQQQIERLKKEWREEWEAEQRNVSPQEVRASIDRKIAAIRDQLEHERAERWKRLSPETRRACELFERLKARDEARMAAEDGITRSQAHRPRETANALPPPE